jgi:hypothetical protein
MFKFHFSSSSRYEMPRVDSPSIESGSSPIPDSDTEEEARIAEARATEVAERTQGASSSIDTGDMDIKLPLPQRLFSKFRHGSRLNLSRTTIAPVLTHSLPEQEFRELDMWCRNKLDAIVVNPYDKQYFIPITLAGDLDGFATKYISVFRDTRGYFILGSFSLHFVVKHLWYLSLESKKDIERDIDRGIESIRQKYFISIPHEESTAPDKVKHYLTLEAARFIESTTNMYVSNRAK